MYKKLFTFLICFQLALLSYSQDLIQNGDFEVQGADTMGINSFFRRAKWDFVEMSAPLFYSTNFQSQSRMTLNNTYGSQNPHKGKVYIGLRSVAHLYTTLKKPLEAGKYYCFTMYVSMGEKYAEKGEIGARFVKNIEMATEKKTNPITTFDKPNFDVMLQATDTADWVRICGTYKAKGGEKFVVIGNFNSVYKNKENTHIFVDDISLIPQLDNNFDCCPEEIHAKSGDTITLKNLLFKSSSAIIETSSFAELDRFIVYLKENKQLKIQINGHTDNSGNTQNNLQLSKNRAKSVYSYMLSKGIKAERMAYNGYGSTIPLSANDTEENKAKNRRVEVVFKK